MQQRLVPPQGISHISDLLIDAKRSDTRVYVTILVIVITLTPLLILAGNAIGFGYTLAALVVLIIMALVTFSHMLGFYLVVGSMLVVDQSPLVLPNIGTVIGKIYIFYWPDGLTGLIERPIGFFILFLFFLFICKRLLNRQKPLYGGELLLPFLLFLGSVAIGVVHGISSGGNFKIIVLEIRPFWYLFLSYLLAYNLISKPEQVRIFFWMVIIGAGIKGLVGSYIYFVLLHMKLTGYHEIMSHEESFFFVAVLLLILLFCILHNYRPQLIAALIVLPFLLISLIANQRRTDYVALLVAAVVVWAITFVAKPQARKKLGIGMLIFAILAGAYIAAFARAGGSLAEPARAVISVFHPDQTDTTSYLSNLYRLAENFDLKYTVKQSPLIGYGFGKQFLQPLPLADLSNSDPNFNGNPYLYIPHNTVYWVWMRLGALGYFAFWLIIGSIIIRGCLIARQLKHPYLQLVAIFVVGVTFMEVIVAYGDYQLYFYRNVIYIGILAGILMRLPALDTDKEQPVHEHPRRLRWSTMSGLGSERAQLPSAQSAGAPT